MNALNGEVDVLLFGKRIGYVKPWQEWPATWDGFSEIEDLPTDDLVCNGASRSYCEYKIYEARQKHLMTGLETFARTMCTTSDRRKFSERIAMILECGTMMRECLAQHYRAVAFELERASR